MKYKAKIMYIMKETHPDREYVQDWTPDKTFSFDAIYSFSDGIGYGKDEMMEYIKRDLKLVAGGGYNWKHIDNVKFDIRKVYA